MTYGYFVAAGSSPQRKGPGRPRKWASEPERVRAYRERKALEHASVDELRSERRQLKRKLSDVTRARAGAEAKLEKATRRVGALEAEVERLRRRLRKVEADAEAARVHCLEQSRREEQATSSDTPGTRPSRQQRRAMERQSRKRRR